MLASAPRKWRNTSWSSWRILRPACDGAERSGMPQAARRWAEPTTRPSVSLSVSANAPAAREQSPDRIAAAERDGALVARARAGDSAAFDALVQTYMEQAFRVAYRVVGHR